MHPLLAEREVKMTALRDGSRSGSVELFWIPLSAGGVRLVQWSGRLFEAVVASREHRPACDLYHSALRVTAGGDYFTIEMAPVWSGGRYPERDVVGEGAVGLPWLGRSRLFRSMAHLGPPERGRAPGWAAGLTAAASELANPGRRARRQLHSVGRGVRARGPSGVRRAFRPSDAEPMDPCRNHCGSMA